MIFFLSVRWRVTSPTRQLADTFSDLMTTLINSTHSRKVANLFVQMISIKMSAFWPMVSASWWSVSWHVGEVTGYLTLMALVLIVLLWKHSKQNLDRHFLAHSSQNFTWCRISWDKIFLHEYFVFRFYLASYQVLTSTFLIPLELRNVLPQAPKTNTTLCRWLPIHLDLTCCPSVPIQAWDLRTKLEITTTATKRYTWKIAYLFFTLFVLFETQRTEILKQTQQNHWEGRNIKAPSWLHPKKDSN